MGGGRQQTKKTKYSKHANKYCESRRKKFKYDVKEVEFVQNTNSNMAWKRHNFTMKAFDTILTDKYAWTQEKSWRGQTNISEHQHKDVWRQKREGEYFRTIFCMCEGHVFGKILIKFLLINTALSNQE